VFLFYCILITFALYNIMLCFIEIINFTEGLTIFVFLLPIICKECNMVAYTLRCRTLYMYMLYNRCEILECSKQKFN